MKHFELFHFYSKRKPSTSGPRDARTWPETWKTIYYKVYERNKSYLLPSPAPLSTGITEAILARRSSREYSGTLTIEQLSGLLGYSSGEHKNAEEGAQRRVYASGGARYPIETYVILARAIGDLKPGLYHYNVRGHALVLLCEERPETKKISDFFIYPEVANAACAFIYTGVFSRQVEKYGDRGYRLVLMEAGGIGEHVGIIAASLGVAQCPMSGYDDAALETHLDVDGVTESVVHTIVLG